MYGSKLRHTCHATDCTIPVDPEIFMCRPHWISLPTPMRDAIWKAYRIGHCDDWKISQAYADAARSAISFIAEKEEKQPDVKLYNMLEPQNDAARRSNN